MRWTPLLAPALVAVAACGMTDPIDSTAGSRPLESRPAPALRASISGPTCVDRAGDYVFRAVVQPWDSTYTFEWRRDDGSIASPRGNPVVLVALGAGRYQTELELSVVSLSGGRAEAVKVVRVLAAAATGGTPASSAPSPCADGPQVP
jgi:hypothetical protein